MDVERRIVYVCHHCLTVSENAGECCDEMMIQCDAGLPGDERSRPLMTADGELVTRAPRWWVERCLEARKLQQKQA